uniref:Translocase of chloroplast 120, chloroplastic-like n=1 Tax=Cicer arietinum TaxID=3827 RepID=A0A3Q7XG56_CICAR|nr:translocase of chloroplast 120, chloroplastic-like [Cicer arietinum]
MASQMIKVAKCQRLLEISCVVDGFDTGGTSGGVSSEKAENEDHEYFTPRENGGMILENGSTDKVDCVVDEFHTESKFNNEMQNQGIDAGDLKKVGLDPGLKDEKIEEQYNASDDPYSEIQDDTCEKTCRHSVHRNFEPHCEILIEMENQTVGTDINQEDTNSKGVGISDSQRIECKEYSKDHETENNDAGLNSEHLETIGETGESSRIVDESKEIETAGSSSLSKNSLATEMPTVQATAVDSEEGSTEVYRSKISNEENLGNYENFSVVGELKKIPEKNAKEKETTHISKKTDTEAVSSSGKSVATTTTLVPPAGLGPAAPLLKPAPPVVQQPRVNNSVSNLQSQKLDESSSGEAEEYDETR